MYQVVNFPYSIDLVPHLPHSCLFHWCIAKLSLLLLSLQSFDVIDELVCFSYELIHSLRLTIPVWIVDKLEEYVENSAFNFLTIAVRVQIVPELHQEFFFSSLTLLLFNLNCPFHHSALGFGVMRIKCSFWCLRALRIGRYKELFENFEDSQDLANLFNGEVTRSLIINDINYSFNISDKLVLDQLGWLFGHLKLWSPVFVFDFLLDYNGRVSIFSVFMLSIESISDMLAFRLALTSLSFTSF